MDRRQFVRRIGGTLVAAAVAPTALLTGASELSADVVIAGGGVGGCAAALAAARNGLRVVMTESTDWVGGQLTQQAVPPDEHAWIEQFGAPASYRAFRDGVRRFYKESYPLTGSAVRTPYLNPGNCYVSRICHEPRAALAVLEQMLASYVSNGRLTILLEHEPIGASVTGDRVEALTVRDLRSGRNRRLTATYFVDATELGDLLPMTGTEYVTGAESREDTGELHAAREAQPANMQAMTWCFAMDYVPGEEHVIDQPPNYGFWRDYVPEMTPPWPGRLLSLTTAHYITREPRTFDFDPRPDSDEPGLWAYRRLIDPSLYAAGTYSGGISLANWPQNDYLLGNIIEVDAVTAERHLRQARELSLALFYWLQTEAPRPDGGTGWPGLRLRGDITGTTDGLAKRPYIREARRIKAEFTVLEQHVGTEARMTATNLGKDQVTAEHFPDSVGIGSYRIDLHPSTGGDNYIDVSSLPFEIPLGALLPIRMENLLPACKNIGTTHITNGCYRLHPVEWNIGEAVGSLTAFCLSKSRTPRQVRGDSVLLEDYQALLSRQGLEIRWPDPLRSPR